MQFYWRFHKLIMLYFFYIWHNKLTNDLSWLLNRVTLYQSLVFWGCFFYLYRFMFILCLFWQFSVNFWFRWVKFLFRFETNLFLKAAFLWNNSFHLKSRHCKIHDLTIYRIKQLIWLILILQVNFFILLD